MKVVLLKDVPKVGKKNEVVDVSDGFARNFLLKNRSAVIYTKTADMYLQTDLKAIAETEKRNIEIANELKEKIQKLNLVFFLKTNNGNVFGEISNKAIIDKLADEKIKIDKYMLKDNGKIGIGKRKVNVYLHKQVVAELSIEVKEK